jgi:hypothetical protein
LKVSWRFGRICHLHLQGKRINQTRIAIYSNLVSLSYSPGLKIEILFSSETSGGFLITTECYVPENITLRHELFAEDWRTNSRLLFQNSNPKMWEEMCGFRIIAFDLKLYMHVWKQTSQKSYVYWGNKWSCCSYAVQLSILVHISWRQCKKWMSWWYSWLNYYGRVVVVAVAIDGVDY